MSRVILAASKYVQGPGVLDAIGTHASVLGKNAFAIGGRTALSLVAPRIRQSLTAHGIEYAEEIFGGISSQDEISRLSALSEQAGADMILAIGGGAALDAGKAVSHHRDLPVIVIPTTAATDGPCSALSVLYTNDGIFDRYIALKRNPDCVLMDTSIIAKAPSRFLIAGMGDAVAAFWESQTCVRSGRLNAFSGGATPSVTIRNISRLCYQTLLKHGCLAIKAAEKGIPNSDFEAIVEANTLMSGLSAENGGHAAAHSIHNGLTCLEKTRKKLHGEKVAFGLLAQLILEGHPKKAFEEVQTFCYSVGLPICLEDLGLDNVNPEEIKEVARQSVLSDETIHASWFEVTADQVEVAIWLADDLGKSFKKNNSRASTD